MIKYFVLLLIGILIGRLITLVQMNSKSVGTLQVIESDELEQPYIFLELNDEVETLCDKKYVHMDVKWKSQSQK